MMSRILMVSLMVGATVLLGPGCGRSGSPQEEGLDDERDYGEVLRRAREKQEDGQKADRLRDSIETFQTDHGRPPSNLVEMVMSGYLEEVPEAPPGKRFEYDASEGVILTLDADEL